MLEGLGFVTRISKNQLIFTGLRGMQNRVYGSFLMKILRISLEEM